MDENSRAVASPDVLIETCLKSIALCISGKYDSPDPIDITSTAPGNKLIGHVDSATARVTDPMRKSKLPKQLNVFGPIRSCHGAKMRIANFDPNTPITNRKLSFNSRVGQFGMAAGQSSAYTPE